jgi:histidinol-phosphate aminotransferase
METRLSSYFNDATRRALHREVGGYVDNEVSVEAEMASLGARYGLDRIYRFDLGENAHGFSPRIQDYLDALSRGHGLRDHAHQWFNPYPDLDQRALRRGLGDRFGIPAGWILVGAGLDGILALIAQTFLDRRDRYLMPVPSFFLFEELSARMGASPVFLPLREEDGFRWTPSTSRQYRELLAETRPKLVWLANPNNPTGHLIPEAVIEDLVDAAWSQGTLIVVDEAYGEFVDPPGGVSSAARLLYRYPNLMVLRTFSKNFGLAGLRLGYLMCANPDLHMGLKVHKANFSVTRAAADLATIALEDLPFVRRSGVKIRLDADHILEQLGGLADFEMLPTHTCIFLLKHRGLSGPGLRSAFEQMGIITSEMNITGLAGKGYLRLTVRSRLDNDYLIQACRAIQSGRIWRDPASRPVALAHPTGVAAS